MLDFDSGDGGSNPSGTIATRMVECDEMTDDNPVIGTTAPPVADPRTFTFSDGSVFTLGNPWWDEALTAKLTQTGQSIDEFAAEFVAATEEGWTTKTVLTKFGRVKWGDYPADESYEDVAHLAGAYMYAFLRAYLMAMALRELAKADATSTPAVVKTLNDDGTVTDVKV